MKINCENCLKTPIIELVYENPKILNVHCDCGYQNQINIIDFIKQFSHQLINNSNKDESINDDCHYYCLICKGKIKNSDFCVHLSHKKINLDEYFDKRRQLLILSKLDEIKSYLLGYYTEIKEELISKLQNEINQINICFNQNYLINVNLLETIKILFSLCSHNRKDYQTLNNLFRNFNCFTPQFNYKPQHNCLYEKIENLKNFYRSTFIFLPKPPPTTINLNNIKLIESIESHTDKITKIILLNDGRIASSSFDYTIKIFNIKKFQCEITIKDNYNIVFDIIQLSNGTLLSGSRDSMIRMFDIHQFHYSCIHTISLRRCGIMLLYELTNNRFACCEWVNEIFIFSFVPPYICLGHFQNSTNIYSLTQINQTDLILLLSTNSIVNIWNIKQMQLVSTFQLSHVGDVFVAYNFTQNKIALGDFEKLMIYNITSCQIESYITFLNFQKITAVIKINNKTLICGGADGKVGTVNLERLTIESIGKLDSCSQVNNFIGINQTYLFCSSNNKILVWKY